jgi:uncharacterized protein DUF4394
MRYLRTVVLAAAAMLGACGGDNNDPVGPGPDPDPTPSPGPGPGSVLQGRAIFGLTCANGLVLFGSGNPGTLVRDVPITGMAAGSVMLGIDFSPASGALYGVGSDSRVYTIDTLSGAATAVGGTFAPAAAGEHFGISFDADGRLTLQGVESNQQQTLDPATGAVSSADVELAFGAGDAHAGENPALAASGYYAGTMYGIETNANVLVTVSPSGELGTVGEVGFNLYLCSGLDIDSDGTAYAALSTDTGNELYTIDLGTGAATLLGDIGGGPVHSIALRP